MGSNVETDTEVRLFFLNDLCLGQMFVELECRRVPAPVGVEDQVAAQGAFFQEANVVHLVP